MPDPVDPSRMARDLGATTELTRPLALGPAVLDVDRLPSVPEVNLELKRLLAEPKTTPTDIAAVVQRDPAIAAKLLQLVNSALFPHKSPVNDVDVAVARLGMTTVQAVATCAAIFSATSARTMPRGVDVGGVQARALRAGAIARRIAPGDGDVFLAALLADVGYLAMAVAAPEAWERAAAASAVGSAAEEAALLGTDHAEIGAYLLSRWELPSLVVVAVAAHHDLAHAPVGTARACGAAYVACARAEGRAPDRDSLLRVVEDAALVDAWIARTALLTP